MKRIMTYAVLIAIGVYLGLPGIASTKDTQVGVADQVFAMMAAEGGLTEVQLGKLAVDQLGRAWTAGACFTALDGRSTLTRHQAIAHRHTLINITREPGM